ncbi:hypothetical protein FB451DRAFT_1922 [Mycena latifolia]|nr:hypothetical protein FB451DRAFT_1922 [Mycena latifolia]
MLIFLIIVISRAHFSVARTDSHSQASPAVRSDIRPSAAFRLQSSAQGGIRPRVLRYHHQHSTVPNGNMPRPSAFKRIHETEPAVIQIPNGCARLQADARPARYCRPGTRRCRHNGARINRSLR